MKTFNAEIKKKTILLCRHQVLVAFKSVQVTREQFLAFTIQRHVVASGFVDLVARGRDLSQDQRLRSCLAQNWVDETGGRNPTASHAVWREDYIRALGIEGVQAEPFAGTHQYINIVAGLIQSGSALNIAGAILFLEHSIPPEFICLQRARELLFPSLSSRACLYLDDHIQHDAKHHYPDLLHALTHYEANLTAASKIREGIERIFRAKLLFYDSIRDELGF